MPLLVQKELTMTLSSLLEEVFQSPTIVAESLLLGLILALIGAGGFAFFILSMKDDRGDKIMERVNNPWETVSRKEETKAPPKSRRRKLKTVLCVIIVVLVVLICLLLALKFG